MNGKKTPNELAFDLPYVFYTANDIIYDLKTHYNLEQKSYSGRSLVIPENSFCWPQVVNKTDLFSNINAVFVHSYVNN